MSKQILNRREDVYVNATPPEILTEAKLSADGFVKDTDYAKADAGGVIKTGNAYAVSVTTAGALTSQVKTVEQYTSGNTNMFISKGTLENIFQTKSMNAWVNLMLVAGGVLDPDTLPEGAVISDLTLTKTSGGFVFSATKTEPTPPENPETT